MSRPAEVMREIGKLGGRPPGRKNNKTLEMEARRDAYLVRISDKWEEIVAVHLASALDPANKDERKEVIHQFIGKPVEKMEVEQTTTLRVDV